MHIAPKSFTEAAEKTANEFKVKVGSDMEHAIQKHVNKQQTAIKEGTKEVTGLAPKFKNNEGSHNWIG